MHVAFAKQMQCMNRLQCIGNFPHRKQNCYIKAFPIRSIIAVSSAVIVVVSVSVSPVATQAVSHHMQGCLSVVSRWVKNNFSTPKEEIIKIIEKLVANYDNISHKFYHNQAQILS